MFCTKCGKEIDNNAVMCPNCGCATSYRDFRQNDTMAELQEQNLVSSISNLGTLSLIFAFIIPIVSIILAIVGFSKISSSKSMIKTNSGKYAIDKSKSKMTAGIIISVVGFVIVVIPVIIVTIFMIANS
ncbi:MAG: zinc-ribbon domain-containing protein [Clostridia bacterium]|nr:zinc-ribbon domain-containing protein [Clostridia bacterium]